jgi:hypothetical protein
MDTPSHLSLVKVPMDWVEGASLCQWVFNIIELLRIDLVNVSSTIGWHIPCRKRAFYLIRWRRIDEMMDFLTNG